MEFIQANIESLGENFLHFCGQFNDLLDRLSLEKSKPWYEQAKNDSIEIALYPCAGVNSITIETSDDEERPFEGIYGRGLEDLIPELLEKGLSPEEIQEYIQSLKIPEMKDFYIRWNFTSNDKYNLGIFIDELTKNLNKSSLSSSNRKVEVGDIIPIEPFAPDEPIKLGADNHQVSLVIRYGVEDLEAFEGVNVDFEP